MPPNTTCRPWRSSIATAFTVLHDFTSRPRKPVYRRTSAPKSLPQPASVIHCSAETREGYQNLCRLITRMKLRAPKGKGAITEEELAAYARGLICLTGGEYGPLTLAIPENDWPPHARSIDRDLRSRKRLCRTSTPLRSGRRSNQPAGAIASRKHSVFRCWRQMASAMPCLTSGKSSTSSPAFEIIAHWKPPAACLRKIRSVI